MSKFHASLRDILEDIHVFLSSSLQNEVLSSSVVTHKEKLLSRLSCIQRENPELQLNFSSLQSFDGKGTRPESMRYSASSPIPYVDMNGGSPYKIPSFPSNAVEESYDLCSIKDKTDYSENHSLTGSEDYVSDEAKNVSDVAASDLNSCEKSGFLDKKKRGESPIKGWLNPFQKRWCAIKDGILYYYEKPTDRKQRGSIVLAGFEARPLPEDNKDGKKYNHCFELVCPGKRTYQFSAASEKDLSQWIYAVERNNKILNFGKLANQDLSSPSNTVSNESTRTIQFAEDIYETVEDDVEGKAPVNELLKVSFKESGNNHHSVSETEDPQNAIFNYNEWYVGLWDCSGADDTELSFLRGDLIHIVSKEYDSYAWWIGELQGKKGFVPKSYLMEAYEAC